MMAVDDVQFPPSIAEGAEGGPSFSTSVNESSGGHEQRIANWATARHRYNVGTGLKDESDVATLLAFFLARQGKLRGFRFKDWADYIMPRQTIGATDGVDATWQIFRRYTSGSINIDRKITRPVAGSVRVWVNNVEIASGGAADQYQVNVSTGIITLGSTLAATSGQAIEAACEFDVPARFDTDALPLRLTAYQIGEWPDIPVVEVRE
jgi:uncharacterized protein (TIGR02217 family)